MADSDTGNGDLERRSTIARRVGSASEWKT
jgi:hypothetical protein